MLRNRSIPDAAVIPQLPYPDVGAAADWLCRVFGFTVRIRIGDHRVQLNVGDGAVVAMEPRSDSASQSKIDRAYPMVRVEDVFHHCEQARERGAHIVREPADHVYGERQYTAEDLAGHQWTFSQSIADVNPGDWGGEPGNL
jgi:uncharacterized glyoxalase superfamily protein PhnB